MSFFPDIGTTRSNQQRLGDDAESFIDLTLTPPQEEFLHLSCKHPAFVAGFGCVHPHTKVYTEDGLMRICDIKPLTRVLSWNETNQRFQLSLSGGSYPKGKANLHRVSTPSGEFLATEHHHSFSSDHKYVSVGSLHAGDSIAVVSSLQQMTTKELDRLLSSLDVQRYSETDANYLVRYVTEARLHGLQLLTAGDIDQSYLPSPDDAHRLSFLGDFADALREGGKLARKLSRNRRGQYCDHRSKSHFLRRTPNPACGAAGQISTSLPEHISGCHRTTAQSHAMIDGRCSIEQHSSDDYSFVHSLSDDEVVSITDSGEEVYWDMQVLGTNNYVTEGGHIHHNTGKSQTMTVSAVIDAMEGGADSVIAILEPTWDLCKMIAIPRIEMILNDLGIRYKVNKSDKMIYTSHGGMGDFLLRSMNNPETLVGWEAWRSHCDEIDTLKKDDAKAVWMAMIARTRKKLSDVESFEWLPERPMNRISAYCTPEGFNFMYGRWAKDKERSAKAGYLMIQAGTHTNPFLPDDYLSTLRASYDDKRFNAYANGLFVNLKGGTVYHSFDRKLNGCNTEIAPGEELFVGQDFNVNKMATVIYVKRWGDDGLEEAHAVAEIPKGVDTPDVITKLKERYIDIPVPHHINIYPDASGKNTSSKSASESDVGMLEQAGFTVHVHGANPRVRDRVISMNTMICDANGRRRLLVNEKNCPNFCDCLEQQIYGENGEPDKKGGKDHMNDAGGYPIVYRFQIMRDMIHDTSFKISFSR
uniref:Terminase large subunit gp17-like C-terminal domain-containing protein n=1 Tax=Pectobacterium phage Koroua TaxID=3158138 RepID=A0AB39ABK4_9CAUD